MNPFLQSRFWGKYLSFPLCERSEKGKARNYRNWLGALLPKRCKTTKIPNHSTYCHRTITARRDLCSLLSLTTPFPQTGQLKQAAQGHIQSCSVSLQGWGKSLPPLSTCSHLWQVPRTGEPRARASTPDVSHHGAEERRRPPSISWRGFSSGSPTCYLRPSLASFVTRAYRWLVFLLLYIWTTTPSCFPAGEPLAILAHGLISPRVQDLAFPFVELHKIAFCTFLQPSEWMATQAAATSPRYLDGCSSDPTWKAFQVELNSFTYTDLKPNAWIQNLISFLDCWNCIEFGRRRPTTNRKFYKCEHSQSHLPKNYSPVWAGGEGQEKSCEKQCQLSLLHDKHMELYIFFLI